VHQVIACIFQYVMVFHNLLGAGTVSRNSTRSPITLIEHPEYLRSYGEVPQLPDAKSPYELAMLDQATRDRLLDPANDEAVVNHALLECLEHQEHAHTGSISSIVTSFRYVTTSHCLASRPFTAESLSAWAKRTMTWLQFIRLFVHYSRTFLSCPWNRYLSAGVVNMQQVDVGTRHAPNCMPSADDPEGRNAGMPFKRFPDFVSRVSADLVSTLH
jgi:hypothetical protein